MVMTRNIICLAFIWSLFHLVSAQNLTYVSSEVCSEGYKNSSRLCYPSDPQHRWDEVSIDCHSVPNAVAVRFFGYNADAGAEHTLSRQEVRLYCTGLDNNQTEVQVTCSGNEMGRDAVHDGFVHFINITEAGIQPGSTCVTRGCFSYSTSLGDQFFFTPTSIGCTLPPDISKTSTPEPTTPPGTTTVATTVKTDSKTTTSPMTFTHSDITEAAASTYFIPAILTPVVVVVLGTIAALLLFRMKQQRNRKTALLVFDKQNMIFDPSYTPAVCIHKPAPRYSHRTSLVSMDLLQYLHPVENTSFFGECDFSTPGNNYVDEFTATALPQCHGTLKTDYIRDTNGEGVTMYGEDHTREFPDGSGYVLSNHTEAVQDDEVVSFDNISEGTILGGNCPEQNYINGDPNNVPTRDSGSSGLVMHNTMWSADQENVTEDTLSLLLREDDTPRRDVGDIDLDRQQSFLGSEYVLAGTTSNVPVISNESPDNVFELDIEENEEEYYCGDVDPPQPLITHARNSYETEGYLDSEQFGVPNLHQQRDRDESAQLDLPNSSPVLDSTMLTHRSLDSNCVFLDDRNLSESQTGNSHITNINGYILDVETSPTHANKDKDNDNESLDLTFDLESSEEDLSSSELKVESDEGLIQLQNNIPSLLTIINTDSDTCDLDTPCAPPSTSSKTRGYVTCEDIVTTELSTREIVVPTSLLSPSAETADLEPANFTVHLDFDDRH